MKTVKMGIVALCPVLLMSLFFVQSCKQSNERNVSLTYPENFKLISHKGLIDGKGYADFGVTPGWVTLVFQRGPGEYKAITFKVEPNGNELYLDLKEEMLNEVFNAES